MERKVFIKALERSLRCKCFGLTSVDIINKELFNDEETHTLVFYFFDGFAYCPNYNGKKYMIRDLPRLDYFKDHPTEAKEILEDFSLTDVKEISPYMVSVYYGTISEEGEASKEDLDIDYEEEEKLYEEKEEKEVNEAENKSESEDNSQALAVK